MERKEEEAEKRLLLRDMAGLSALAVFCFSPCCSPWPSVGSHCVVIYAWMSPCPKERATCSRRERYSEDTPLASVLFGETRYIKALHAGLSPLAPGTSAGTPAFLTPHAARAPPSDGRTAPTLGLCFRLALPVRAAETMPPATIRGGELGFRVFSALLHPPLSAHPAHSSG